MSKKYNLSAIEELKKKQYNLSAIDALKKKDEPIGTGTVLSPDATTKYNLTSQDLPLPEEKRDNPFERFSEWGKFDIEGNRVPFSKRYNDYIANYESNMTEEEKNDLYKQVEKDARDLEFKKPDKPDYLNKRLDRTDLLLTKILVEESVMTKAIALPLAKTIAGLTEVVTDPTKEQSFKDKFSEGWKFTSDNIRKTRQDLKDEDFTRAERYLALGAGLLADAGVFKGMGYASSGLYKGTKAIAKGLYKIVNPALAEKIAAQTTVSFLENLVAGGIQSGSTLAQYAAANKILDNVHDGIPLADQDWGETLRESGKAGLTGVGLGMLGATTGMFNNAIEKKALDAGRNAVYKTILSGAEVSAETGLFATTGALLNKEPLSMDDFVESLGMVLTMKATGGIQKYPGKLTEAKRNLNKDAYNIPFTKEESDILGMTNPSEVIESNTVKAVMENPDVPLITKAKVVFAATGNPMAGDYSMKESRLSGQTIKTYNEKGELLSSVDYTTPQEATKAHQNNKFAIVMESKLKKAHDKLTTEEMLEVETKMPEILPALESAFAKNFSELSPPEKDAVHKFFSATDPIIKAKEKEIEKQRLDQEKAAREKQTDLGDGLTISEKYGTPSGMRRLPYLKDADNLSTRTVSIGGKEFGYITVQEGEDWRVKDVRVDKERTGAGKKIYRYMNEMAGKEGKVLISDVTGQISDKARGLWESLVKSGEAEKLEDGSYRMKGGTENAKGTGGKVKTTSGQQELVAGEEGRLRVRDNEKDGLEAEPPENEPLGTNAKTPQKEVKEGTFVFGGFNFKDSQINTFVNSLFSHMFRARGNKPKDVQTADITRKENITTTFKEADMAMRELRDAMRDTYGKRIPKDLTPKIDKALKTIGQTETSKAKALSDLPSEIHPQVLKMRDMLDKLSDQLIEAGVVSETLIPTFNANKGVYITRAYRAHTDKNWTWKYLSKKKPELIDNAIRDVVAGDPTLTKEGAENILKRMLYEDPYEVIVKPGTRLGAKDAGILFKRQNLSEPIREFLGEYKDPFMNFAISVAKMSTLAENHKFLTKVKELGMNKFLFTEETDGFRTPIAEPGDYRMTPLTTRQKWVDKETGRPVEVRKSLYTSKEIANEFADIFGLKGDIKDPVLRTVWNAYTFLNSAIRQGKTKYSLKTAQRNFLSSFLPNIAAGAINPFSRKNIKAAKTAFQYYGYEFGARGNPQLKSLILEMTKRGVLGENTNSKMLAQDASRMSQFYEDFGSLSTNNGWRDIDRFASKYYRMGDDAHKVFRFMYEKANYTDVFKKQFPDKPPQEIESMAMDKAAKIIRATMQTYSLVPKGIQSLRHIPMVGGVFPSFPYEVIRNTIGMGMLIAEEMKSPYTRPLAMRRIAGSFIALSGPAGISSYFATKNNISDDDEKNMRKFVYKEAQLDDMVVLDNKGDGVYVVWNPTYSDYYSYLKKFAIYPWMKEENFNDAFDASIRQFFEPFIGKDIIGQTLMAIRNNQDNFSGKKIYNEADDPNVQLSAKMDYLRKVFQPGFASYIERLTKSATGRSKTKPLEETIAEITGQKAMTINVGLSFQQKAKEIGEMITNAQSIYLNAYYDVKYKRGFTDPDLDVKKSEAEEKINVYIQELNDLYDSAGSLGVPKKELDTIISKRMKVGGYTPNKSVINAIKYKDKKIRIDKEKKRLY